MGSDGGGATTARVKNTLKQNDEKEWARTPAVAHKRASSSFF
jgi:hypothetical protein